MITVSELAKDLNVSVQAIYKKINKSMKIELSPHVKNENGQKIIDEIGVELIKNGLKPFLNQSEPNSKNPANNGDNLVLNQFKPGLNVEDDESLKEQLKSSSNAVETVLNQFKTVQTVQSEEILFLRERIKELEREKEQNQTALECERKHSRQQSDRIADLASQLAELTRNGQVLLKQEQNRTAFLLSESSSENNDDYAEQPQDNNKKGFWQRFWKK